MHFAAAMLGCWGADDPGEIRSVLRRFNEAVRTPQPQCFQTLFTSHAGHRDGVRNLKRPAAILSLLTAFPVHNQPSMVRAVTPDGHEGEIRFVGPLPAFVGADLVQYSSTIAKSSAPVVLLLEKIAGAWKVSCWRVSGCQVALPAQ